MPTENKPDDPFGPNGHTFHIHLSVRGALRDFSKRQLTRATCMTLLIKLLQLIFPTSAVTNGREHLYGN
jgi:hypothetical protein